MVSSFIMRIKGELCKWEYVFFSAGLCLGQGVLWFFVQQVTYLSVDRNRIVHTWPGRWEKQMRDKERVERKIRVNEWKEQFLWPVGLELLGFCSRRYQQTIIHFRWRGCCDDSPRVKCPIETTAQCVYFLCLSIWCHYSSFSACACQPHHLQTYTENADAHEISTSDLS